MESLRRRQFDPRFPELKVDANALFLHDGPFYTSAGITAGIDLSLALIEEDAGAYRERFGGLGSG